MKVDKSNIKQYRTPHPSGDLGDADNGAFLIPGPCGNKLMVICSDGMGWDHVSVSLKHRCPLWKEMVFIKDLFFDEQEAVMQLHPPKANYRSFHKYCLHMWRPQWVELPLPDAIMVAP